MKPLLSSISVAVLRSAWVEPDPLVRQTMWNPLLTLLRGTFTNLIIVPALIVKSDFSHVWDLEAAPVEADDDDDEDSDDGEDEPKEPKPQKLPVSPVSKAYPEFLQFLQLGCNGSPLQGYPTIIVILSTIPSTVSFMFILGLIMSDRHP